MYCHHNEIPKQVDLNLDLSLSQNKLASWKDSPLS
jgi:hypothetical protein